MSASSEEKKNLPTPPPIPPLENLPISLKNVSYSFPNLSEFETKLTLATITLFPGFQETDDKIIQRNWNFMIQGSIRGKNKINGFIIQFDLSKVQPDLDIDFGGLLHGTLQIGRKIYPSDRLLLFVPDNNKNTIQLVFQLPCPKRSFHFYLNATIADDIQSQGCVASPTSCQLGNGSSINITSGNCRYCDLNGVQTPVVDATTPTQNVSSAFFQDGVWYCTGSIPGSLCS